MTTRRQFLKTLGLGGLVTGGAFASTSTLTTDDLECIERKIIVPSLPRDFENYRIGLLSDPHFGPAIPHEWIEKAIAFIARSKVNLVILTGDYIWVPESIMSRTFHCARNKKFAALRTEELAAAIYPDFADLLSPLNPNDGIVGVYGNHDRWNDPKLCETHLGGKGVHLLVNETRIISRGESRLTIIGVDDYWTGAPALPALGPKSPQKDFRLLVSHNPDFVSDVLHHEGPIVDFAVSGHTHGGQIKLPILGAPFFNIRDRRYAEGLVTAQNCPVYVSRGLGVVEIPYRVNCRPEVTVLELRGA